MTTHSIYTGVKTKGPDFPFLNSWYSHREQLFYCLHIFTARIFQTFSNILQFGNLTKILRLMQDNYFKSSGVSHSDGSCVLGRIHSDVSSNIPKKVYHIVTDNFVNLLHISYAWLYKTECWGRNFHAFSFNSHRNCKIFMTNFNFIFDTICVPYIFRKSIFGWNCGHDTPLCDTPLLEDTPLCDTPDEIYPMTKHSISFQ